MTKEQEETKLNANTISWLLTLLKTCPQVVKKGMGAEEFVKELIEAGLELRTYSSEFFGAIKSFLPFIEVCPQVFEPGIGIKTFLNELKKVAVTFDKSVKQTKV